ncbi:MAG: hypothetical protein ABH824_05150 [Nanoarchaeota archaeon]|nr:hypothetical protein [Nanoarchaeota archaeon]MBU1632828.1 hypothetical protein [Nanoarchaeota archaeon]MBU1876479.1 hypothetical protein [Nanoarchaeota archaeon]
MLKIKLSKELENEYYEINREYSKIQDDWKKYNDQIIPEDKEFAKKIIKFIIQVIDYIINNYEKLDIKKYQEFLAYYNYEFLYGPSGDDMNYLDFDEEPVTDFCWDLKDDDFKLTKDKLKEIRTKYSQVISMF